MTNTYYTLISAASPLEQFTVTKFLALDAPILGLNFTLTNLGFYAIITIIVALGLHFLATNGTGNGRLLPSRWSIAMESSYVSLLNMVKEQIGSSPKGEQYLPLIYGLFWFILVSNLIGNVPYSYALGTSVIVSLGLSFIVWFGVTILALTIHKVHFFSYFVPNGTPLVLVPLLVLIELISYVARAFSLGVRLFANLVAGHTLLKILSGMLWGIITSGFLLLLVTSLPLVIFIALVGLEIAVSLIQAYVFTILTCTYVRDAIDLH